ncbi:MAG: hypothetical protein EI684_13710, partial [Candidatus Viridilinea halotolerans]
MEQIDPAIAQLIIKQVGGSGQPPRYGVQYFTAGLDWQLKAFKQEYFSSMFASDSTVSHLLIPAK